MGTPEETRSLGIWLIVGGLVTAGLVTVMIVIGWYSEPRNLILVVAASFLMLLPVYLIGLGIKKIAGADSPT